MNELDGGGANPQKENHKRTMNGYWAKPADDIHYTCPNRCSRNKARESQLLRSVPRWCQFPARFQSPSVQGTGTIRHKHDISWEAVFQICLWQEKKRDDGECFCALTQHSMPGAGGLGPGGSELGPALTEQGLRGDRGACREHCAAMPRREGPCTRHCEGGETGQNITPDISSRSRGETRSQGCTAPRHLGSLAFPQEPQTLDNTRPSNERVLSACYSPYKAERSYGFGQDHRASWGGAGIDSRFCSQVLAWTTEHYPALWRKNRMMINNTWVLIMAQTKFFFYF